MATQSMTLQQVIDAGWPATEKNMKQVTIMAKLDNGIGLTPDEIALVNTLDPDDESELLTRARAVAGMGPGLQVYLTDYLRPLREALKKPSQQLGAWKKLCWKTGENECSAPLADQDTVLSNMKTALGDGSGDVQSFVNAQYKNFLDGKSDTLGSSMVVKYLCETNADFKAHMDKGLKMVELHNPTDGPSQVLNITSGEEYDDSPTVKLGNTCDNDADLCLNLNKAERCTINTLTKGKYHAFYTNIDESYVFSFLHSKDNVYVPVVLGPPTRIGVYDTFLTTNEHVNLFDTGTELVVFAFKGKGEGSKLIVESYVPIIHSESDVPYELWYQIEDKKPTVGKPNAQCNVVGKFALPSKKQIKFNADIHKIESLQASPENWAPENWTPDANSVTVKNNTNDECACYVMLKEYKDITKIKEIRSAYDSLEFFEVSGIPAGSGSNDTITFVSEIENVL